MLEDEQQRLVKRNAYRLKVGIISKNYLPTYIDFDYAFAIEATF